MSTPKEIYLEAKLVKNLEKRIDVLEHAAQREDLEETYKFYGQAMVKLHQYIREHGDELEDRLLHPERFKG